MRPFGCRKVPVLWVIGLFFVIFFATCGGTVTGVVISLVLGGEEDKANKKSYGDIVKYGVIIGIIIGFVVGVVIVCIHLLYMHTCRLHRPRRPGPGPGYHPVDPVDEHKPNPGPGPPAKVQQPDPEAPAKLQPGSIQPNPGPS